MKNIDDIKSLGHLGEKLDKLSNDELSNIYTNSINSNTWFTEYNTNKALRGIIKTLEINNLYEFKKKYATPKQKKNIGLVMAGNIPLVGFHDLLCVLLSGHEASVKLSSQDSILIPILLTYLSEINPVLSDRINIVDNLKNVDAVIATGSDNTARYFKSYFSKIPNIIRKNRTSCAIINGSESVEQLTPLGTDIFDYFGLGCRNVSKLFVPKGYDVTKILLALESYEEVINHHKYHNNYDYNKSIYLVNMEPHLDNGFLLLKEDESFVSPLAVLFYQYYESKQELAELLEKQTDKIQCIVSHQGQFPKSIPFGEAQSPNIDDFADDVDTMKFLCELE